jgi:hypothetical protein
MIAANSDDSSLYKLLDARYSSRVEDRTCNLFRM